MTHMKDGVWLGLIDATNEAIIGTHQGFFKARTVRILADSTRWDADYIINI